MCIHTYIYIELYIYLCIHIYLNVNIYLAMMKEIIGQILYIN